MRLCYNDLAMVMMVLLCFAFETKSAGFGFQGADFSVDVTTVFTAAFGQDDSHGLLLRWCRSGRLVDVDRSRGWRRSLFSNVDWSWRRGGWRVANVDGLWLRRQETDGGPYGPESCDEYEQNELEKERERSEG